MTCKAGLVASAPWVLALALCAGASAQDSNKGAQDNKGDRKAVETHTIRGVIAGVTVEGELAVDYQNRRAVEAEATLLTIVGSPVREGHDAKATDDQNKDGDRAKAGHHRHNLYVMILSPRTEVRDARKGDDKNGSPSTLDAIEIGERVEVRFSPRDDNRSGGNADQARRAKHGRHRTHFGDAQTVTVLPQSADDSHAQGKDSGNKDDDNDKDKDKGQDQK
jgi:hypothetical protein